MRHIAIGVILIAMAQGCTESRDVRAGTQNVRGMLAENVRIDGMKEDLVPIGAVAITKNSTIALSQPQDNTILFFSASGARLGSVGRQGGGPGEFMRIVSMAWLADTLVVTDGNQPRISLISPERRFIRTIGVPARTRPAVSHKSTIPEFPFIMPVGMRAEGVILAYVQTATTGERVIAPFNQNGALALVTPEGTVQKVIALVPYGKTQVNIPQGSVVLPFPNRPRWAAAPDGSRIAIGTTLLGEDRSASISVVVVSVDGDTIFTSTYNVEGTPIPKSLGDSVITAGRTALMHRNPELADAFKREARIPPIYPPLDGLLIGRDGTVWIELNERDEGRPYIALEANGTPVGEVLLPRRSRIAAAERDRVWAIERDEKDVGSLVGYDVSWPERRDHIP